MTPEQKQKMYDLAMRCVRDDKREEMTIMLQEADDMYKLGEVGKGAWTKLGLRMLAVVKLEHMAEFIKTAKSLGKEQNLV